MSNVRARVKHAAFATVAMLAAAYSNAAPQDWSAACYVRPEVVSATPAASSASRGTESFVGLRRTSNPLFFELDISVSGPNETTCTVAGLAKVRGGPGAEALAMVVRPDPSRQVGQSSLCQVLVQATETALELRTTPSCQEQALCGGKVELNGQRFERASKVPLASEGPCFAKRSL
jgi:hypothetical protein